MGVGRSDFFFFWGGGVTWKYAVYILFDKHVMM